MQILKRLVYLLLIFTVLGTDAQATLPDQADKPDPVIGKWIWHHNITVVIHADGSATSDAGDPGTWQFLHNPEAQRKYRVNWGHGKFIDNVVMSEDGKTALLLTNSGRYNIRRATD